MVTRGSISEEGWGCCSKCCTHWPCAHSNRPAPRLRDRCTSFASSFVTLRGKRLETSFNDKKKVKLLLYSLNDKKEKKTSTVGWARYYQRYHKSLYIIIFHPHIILILWKILLFFIIVSYSQSSKNKDKNWLVLGRDFGGVFEVPKSGVGQHRYQLKYRVKVTPGSREEANLW